MNKSTLGDDLEPQKQLVFLRRLKESHERQEDLDQGFEHEFVTSVMRQVDDGRLSFKASEKQIAAMQRIDQRLKGGKNMSKMIDELVLEGRNIVRNGSLASGRMFSLVELLDTAARRELTKGELDALQRLVHEGSSPNAED